MLFEKRIDDLIEAGWGVLESNFDESAFQNWRKEAYMCLSTILGPEHTYTRFFKRYVDRYPRAGLLTGGGILNAAKAELANKVH
jgi:hypothetical protein